MANKSGGASKTGQAASYKANRVWEKNRLRKLRNALKRHPDNLQIVEAMKGVVYRRKTPTVRAWSKTKINIARLYKAFSGHVDMTIFNNQEKVAAGAQLAHRMKWSYKPPAVNEKTMFSLGVRAHTGGKTWA